MNLFIQQLLPDLLTFAGNLAPIDAATNEERVEQLFAWIEGLTESPWEDGVEPHVGIQDAKRMVQQIRYVQQKQAEREAAAAAADGQE